MSPKKPTAASKADTSPEGEQDSLRRQIPAMEKILKSTLFQPILQEYGRSLVKDLVSMDLELLRAGKGGAIESGLAGLAERVEVRLGELRQGTLRRVINGTGVIIHTNLGRAPVSKEGWAESGALVTGYSNLEFDLDQGERGSRELHLAAVASRVFGCEAAILTNNNAAAILLLLASTAAGREVVVSRGELVEIGGSFRVPEVIEQGGAKLREVGTTNRTRTKDYLDAVSRRTAAILRVSRSNFDIVGFTESPTVEEMVEVAEKVKRQLLWDEGSGRVVDLSPYGFRKGTTIRELFEAGVDAVTCSTDKLIGSTQGGLILGRHEIVDRCRKHPLMRALRAGKESHANVSATLLMFARGKHEASVPIYKMLSTPIEELRSRAERLAALPGASVVDSESALGGGTTPTEVIASCSVAIEGSASRIARSLRLSDPPIIGRIVNDQVTLDMRTIFPEEDQIVAAALSRLSEF